MTNPSSNVAVLQAEKHRFSLTPTTIDEAMRFADMLSKSALVPKDYQGNPANCVIAMQWGMEIGLQPLQAMQSIAVINGRPAIWGDAMIAIVRGSSLLESMREDIGETQCTCTVKRRGEAEVSRTYTMEDAKRAGLAGKQGPWSQHPKRMMQMRARAFALRDVFPDVLRGVFVAEEAQDMPRERDITAEGETLANTPATPTTSRTAAVKQRLATKKNHTEELREVADLDSVLSEISAATDEAGLKRAADMAAKLTGDVEKEMARNAYKARKDAMATPPSLTYAKVSEALNTAGDADTLDVKADLIRQVADEGQQVELTELYRALRARMAA